MEGCRAHEDGVRVKWRREDRRLERASQGAAGPHRLEGRLLIPNMRLNKQRCQSLNWFSWNMEYFSTTCLLISHKDRRENERDDMHICYFVTL